MPSSTSTRRCCRRFPGVDAQRQAIEHGVKVSGVTVHLVTAELDGGPIVLQRTVPVLDGDTPDTLARGSWPRSTGRIPRPCRWCWTVDGESTAGDSSDLRAPLQA